MSNIKWSDDLLVGVEEIDDQHKRIVEIAIEAENAYLNNLKFDLNNFMLEVLDYSTDHFDYELSVAKKLGSKHVEKHNIIHTELIKELRAFIGTQPCSLHFALFLNKWIVKHISIEDKKLFEGLIKE